MQQCPVDICLDIHKLETLNWFSYKFLGILQPFTQVASVLSTFVQPTFLQVTFVQVALKILTNMAWRFRGTKLTFGYFTTILTTITHAHLCTDLNENLVGAQLLSYKHKFQIS